MVLEDHGGGGAGRPILHVRLLCEILDREETYKMKLPEGGGDRYTLDYFVLAISFIAKFEALSKLLLALQLTFVKSSNLTPLSKFSPRYFNYYKCPNVYDEFCIYVAYVVWLSDSNGRSHMTFITISLYTIYNPNTQGFNNPTTLTMFCSFYMCA